MGERESFNRDQEVFIKRMEVVLPQSPDFLVKEINPRDLSEKDRELWQAFVGLLNVDTTQPLDDTYRDALEAFRRAIQAYKPDMGTASWKFANMLRNDVATMKADCDWYDASSPDLSGTELIKNKYHK